MKTEFATAMGRALDQVRAGDPAGATRAIQDLLRGREAGASGEPAAQEATRPAPAASFDGIEEAEVLGGRAPRAQAAPEASAAPPRRRMGAAVDALRRLRPKGLASADAGRGAEPARPTGARFERLHHAGPAGARDYRLYIPAAQPEGRPGLVLMLHGCTQTPEDFAAGTGMNAAAERHGLIVLYPHQDRSHNAQGCWNWFRPGDQEAHRGEPALLAELVRAVAARHDVDAGRIFVAGLSAGGAMAATLGATHPELFSAVGVHSGLPHRAAHDVISAFAAMRGDGQAARPAAGGAPRTIVFHGTADATVHPDNAQRLIDAAVGGRQSAARTEQGRSPGGRTWRRETHAAADGTALAELWRIEGSGHAWSGGRAAGSYTDPDGPDASAEMVRFFLAGA
ncbi:extracellular catalytic domain type 1 short-chain-length polyhydroxyalkanoate depolymerase [Cereibacter sphaeroides]|uniref:extracellular catalytic domain type 1 short-chain-length polyhydroxyalkanoate depolymerase n=1 Tax=Cereibacter sphaeroides TaxID=1063 RepID=UPI000191CC13|nr:PHB depolymerase family esterase [Cereibacter sphaeroides]ACM04283.1 Poly (3-hydroxybutyrate) depolymerase [Cereibacter sphaeroides KD131]